MKIIRAKSSDYDAQLQSWLRTRKAADQDIDSMVRPILNDVQSKGDAALVDYALKFDKASLTPDQFKISQQEWDEAIAQVPENVKRSIDTARQHVADFSGRRLPQNWTCNPRPGVMLGEQFTPIDSVGCYIPGGTAPLISTVVHTVTLAATAGVKNIFVTTPPGKDGKVNPALLYACRSAGATGVYRLGGVYGVAALAYGTETVPKVDKIIGPGNAYVASAKRLLYGQVAIDMVAGPSEILVIADNTANPAFIAADILSQSEHGSGREQAVLVSTDDTLLDKVVAEIESQSAKLSRSECVKRVLDNGVYLIGTDSLDKAAEIATAYAPEHLEIITAAPQEVAPKIKAAGAIFMGEWTPEPVGDFVAGPSHVLPTGGSAKYFSGLTADMFFRRTSLLHYEREALMEDLPHILCFANCEGLDAHGNSAAIRSK